MNYKEDQYPVHHADRLPSLLRLAITGNTDLVWVREDQPSSLKAHLVLCYIPPRFLFIPRPSHCVVQLCTYNGADINNFLCTAGWRGAGSQALRLFRWDFLRRASRVCRTDCHLRVQSRGSGSLLPLRRVAAGMETGDNGQGFAFHDEEQRVRKSAQKCPPHVLEHDRKLPGVGAHALDEGVNRFAEMSA